MSLTLGWFSTGRGEGSLGMLTLALKAISSKTLDAHIQFVFSNRGPGEHKGSDRFFQMVRENDIPLIHHSSLEFRRKVGTVANNRDAYYTGVSNCLHKFSPDIIVLAGYMLIVNAELCQRYTMINLHPALPHGPSGTWQEVIWKIIARRDTHSGAMVHHVTEDVDEGQPLTYFTFPIQEGSFVPLWEALDADSRTLEEIRKTDAEENPLFNAIHQEERRREPYLLLETLKSLASGDIHIQGRDVLDSYGKPLTPRCYNVESTQAFLQ